MASTIPNAIATTKTSIFWKITTSALLAVSAFSLPSFLVNIHHGPRDSKKIALTFDDGPNPPYTEKFLVLLEREKIKATFFFLGRNIEMHFATAKKVAAAGHEVANHSYSHTALAWAWPWKSAMELRRTDTQLASLGVQTPLFRSPFGSSWGILEWVLLLQGKSNVLYDVPPIPPDYLRGDPRAIAHSMVQRTRGGSVLLLHDGEGIRVESLEAAAHIIPLLKQKGFEFVTVSELLRKAGPP